MRLGFGESTAKQALGLVRFAPAKQQAPQQQPQRQPAPIHQDAQSLAQASHNQQTVINRKIAQD